MARQSRSKGNEGNATVWGRAQVNTEVRLHKRQCCASSSERLQHGRDWVAFENATKIDVSPSVWGYILNERKEPPKGQASPLLFVQTPLDPTGFLIGKSENPAGIVGSRWPVPDDCPNKAWVKAPVGEKWLGTVFVPTVRKRTTVTFFLCQLHNVNIPGNDFRPSV